MNIVQETALIAADIQSLLFILNLCIQSCSIYSSMLRYSMSNNANFALILQFEFGDLYNVWLEKLKQRNNDHVISHVLNAEYKPQDL